MRLNKLTKLKKLLKWIKKNSLVFVQIALILLALKILSYAASKTQNPYDDIVANELYELFEK